MQRTRGHHVAYKNWTGWKKSESIWFFNKATNNALKNEQKDFLEDVTAGINLRQVFTITLDVMFLIQSAWRLCMVQASPSLSQAYAWGHTLIFLDGLDGPDIRVLMEVSTFLHGRPTCGFDESLALLHNPTSVATEANHLKYLTHEWIMSGIMSPKSGLPVVILWLSCWCWERGLDRHVIGVVKLSTTSSHRRKHRCVNGLQTFGKVQYAIVSFFVLLW